MGPGAVETVAGGLACAAAAVVVAGPVVAAAAAAVVAAAAAAAIAVVAAAGPADAVAGLPVVAAVVAEQARAGYSDLAACPQDLALVACHPGPGFRRDPGSGWGAPQAGMLAELPAAAAETKQNPAITCLFLQPNYLSYNLSVNMVVHQNCTSIFCMVRSSTFLI